MPPAFNLSQDQTLQFNPYKTQSTLAPSHPKSSRPQNKTRLTPTPKGKSFFPSYEHHNVSIAQLQVNIPLHQATQHHSTHTYRLLILKEQAAYKGS
jgi:hypothetical protein